MSYVVAQNGFTDREVAATTEALLRLRPDRIQFVGRSQTWPTDILHALQEPDVELAIMPAADIGLPVWQIARAASKPIILVPANAKARAFSRVLVPLDGTAESAAAVQKSIDLLADTGAELVVLHVFDRTTVPACWDQAAHARAGWEDEFMARFCPRSQGTLHLRSGVPGEHVVDVATTEHADLIVLGWSQRLAEGRAKTVRETVTHAGVPVLLLPMALMTTTSGPAGPH